MSPTRSESCSACPSSHCCWQPAPAARRRRRCRRSPAARSSICRTPTTRGRSSGRRPTPFRLEKVADGMTPGGYYYAANNFFTSEHGGTHIDAPIHFAQGRQHGRPDSARAADRRRRSSSTSPTRRAERRLPGDAADDLQRLGDARTAAFPADAIVLIRTGFSTRWPDARALPRHRRARARRRSRSCTSPACTRRRGAGSSRTGRSTAIGIDTASIDYGQSTLFESHRTLFATRHPGVREPGQPRSACRARARSSIALPMKIAGGSGAPLRAIAIVSSGS